MKSEIIHNWVDKVTPVAQTVTRYSCRLMGHIAMWTMLLVYALYFDGSLFTEPSLYTAQELKAVMSSLIKSSAVLGTVFFGLGVAIERGARNTEIDRIYRTLSSKHGEIK